MKSSPAPRASFLLHLLAIYRSSAFFILPFLLAACENTQVAANYSGNTNGNPGTVATQVTTDISTNATAGLQGAYNLDTGDYTVGFIVTLKQAPDEFLRQQLVRAGAIRNTDTLWVLPQAARARDGRIDVASPVFLALRAAGSAPGGADVLAFTKTTLP